MTDPDPMDQLTVERRLTVLADQLMANTARFKRAIDARNEAQHDYDVAYATAYLGQTEGTIPERKAQAMLETDELYLRKLVTDGELMACRSEKDAILTATEVLRSINTNVRDRVFHPRGLGG